MPTDVLRRHQSTTMKPLQCNSDSLKKSGFYWILPYLGQSNYITAGSFRVSRTNQGKEQVRTIADIREVPLTCRTSVKEQGPPQEYKSTGRHPDTNSNPRLQHRPAAAACPAANHESSVLLLTTIFLLLHEWMHIAVSLAVCHVQERVWTIT